MKLPRFAALTWMLFSTNAEANRTPSFLRPNVNPFCKQDLSEAPLPINPSRLVSPEGFVERGLRPGLLHIQKEVCRCLPRRARDQPEILLIKMHIKPNAGELVLEYQTDPPWSGPTRQMMGCLGKPTLAVEPMPYVSDMITEDGPAEKALVYPIKLTLRE